jgi:hypothetical protein
MEEKYLELVLLEIGEIKVEDREKLEQLSVYID